MCIQHNFYPALHDSIRTDLMGVAAEHHYLKSHTDYPSSWARVW